MLGEIDSNFEAKIEVELDQMDTLEKFDALRSKLRRLSQDPSKSYKKSLVLKHCEA